MASKTESAVLDRIVGTWRLVSTQETLKDGTTRPFPAFGPNAKGFLLYQRDGYVCAILAKSDRTSPTRATAEEQVAAADGSFSYCGRYEIDVKREWIIHLPEVATDPAFVGSRQVRPYSFEGDQLIFSDVEKGHPSVASWRIVWEKVQ